MKTSSIGIRNGWSTSRCGSRDVLVHGLHQFDDRPGPLRVALQRLEGGDLDDRQVVARELGATTMYGTPDWRARSTCSLVCGIGPSVAATTRMAPSTYAAFVIMFLM
ncbi:hypothetical protein AT728_27160 [Streptomyces silvensis]|uniref:Uncharacterized protein n=1 Tax=Streptomyces silvensis TaxID=1765722 RepID=A0A0W7WX88_9ACTN|nr:hypothetical protein AT728_27160 [Streptomyces silvensis]